MRRFGWLIPALYILFLLIPIYWLINMSFKSTNEILGECLTIDLGRRDRAAEMRVSRIMKTLGFKRVQDWNGGVRRWVYRRE